MADGEATIPEHHAQAIQDQVVDIKDPHLKDCLHSFDGEAGGDGEKDRPSPIHPAKHERGQESNRDQNNDIADEVQANDHEALSAVKIEEDGSEGHEIWRAGVGAADLQHPVADPDYRDPLEYQDVDKQSGVGEENERYAISVSHGLLAAPSLPRPAGLYSRRKGGDGSCRP